MIFSRDLQHIYLRLAQKLRQAYDKLSLERVQALARYGLLQLILVRLMQVSSDEAHAILISFVPDELDIPALLPLLAECDALLPNDCFDADSLTCLMSDVIGRVYEQSLAYHLVDYGQGLTLWIDQSLRQRAGAYYTPTVVVKFLVERTVGGVIQRIKDEVETLLLEGHYQAAQISIDRLKMIKVLDITCGSGIFLLTACDILTRAYCWWNECVQAFADEHASFFVETGLRKCLFPAQTILHHCIFGIDRDPQAVAIARLNLSLYAVGAQFIAPAPVIVGDEAGAMNWAPTTLQYNVVVADALDASVDIDALLGEGAQLRIILGNPPWGADMSFYEKGCLSGFALARGQYDSYELCIECATRCLRRGDVLGLVVPDSLLQLPEHAPLREYLLRSYELDTLVKLGEGVFEGVFRGAVVFSATRNEQTATDHRVQCRIVVKQERHDILLAGHSQDGMVLAGHPQAGGAQDAPTMIRGRCLSPIQTLLDRSGTCITQSRFSHNKGGVFDLFTSDEDEQIMRRVEQHALNWRNVLRTGRGVEIAKTGAILACSVCGSWQNIPRKQKNGSYAQGVCVNPMCANRIDYEMCQHATMIMPVPMGDCTQPIIVGEHLNRYQVLTVRYLDLTKGMYVRYKTPDLYSGEKLLIRKTGRGIYATIDKTGAYTNQVVFIFKLKQERPQEQQQLRLSYMLGVLNSRMMLYYYYKSLGDIEWKSFPYMTQDTIMGLPVREIDFSDVRQSYLHDRIADLVDVVIACNKPPDAQTDNEIEVLVRQLYGVDSQDMSRRIDAELECIGTYGSLLGRRRDQL